MTIQQGIEEAFRRLGASKDEIEHTSRVALTFIPDGGFEARATPIDEGKEEEFIAVYMQLAKLIEQGPTRQLLEAYINDQRAHN